MCLCSSEVDPLFNYFCHYEKARRILSLKRPGQSCRVHQSSCVTDRQQGSFLPLSLLLEVFCWSCLYPLTLCHLSPPKWWIKLVPPLMSLSPPFPLPVGTLSFLLLEFTVKWAHVQSQSRSLELGVSVSQGVFIYFYFLYRWFSSLSTLVPLFSASLLLFLFFSFCSYWIFFYLFLFQLRSS